MEAVSLWLHACLYKNWTTLLFCIANIWIQISNRYLAERILEKIACGKYQANPIKPIYWEIHLLLLLMRRDRNTHQWYYSQLNLQLSE